MKYSCSRIWAYIKQNIITYLMLIIATSVGLSILFCCKIVLDKANDDVLKAKEFLANQIIRVEWYGSIITKPSTDDPYPMAISAEKYANLIEQFGKDVDIGFSPYDLISIENIDYENVIYDWLFFMNDTQFEMLFNQKMQRDTIYASGNNYKNLNSYIESNQSSINYDEIYPDNTQANFLKIFDGEICFLEQDKLQLVQTPQSNFSVISHPNPGTAEHDFKLEDILIVSYDYYPKAENYVKERINKFRELPDDKKSGVEASMPMSILNLRLKDGSNIDTLPLLISMLNNNYSNYTFKMDVDGEREQQALENLQNKLLQYQVVAIVMILIVVFISFGTVMVNLQKRKKSFAVAMAFGATKKKLLFEMFLELFFVNAFSSGLAFAATSLLIPYLQKLYFGVNINFPLYMVIAFVAAIALSLLPTMLVLVLFEKSDINKN